MLRLHIKKFPSELYNIEDPKEKNGVNSIEKITAEILHNTDYLKARYIKMQKASIPHVKLTKPKRSNQKAGSYSRFHRRGYNHRITRDRFYLSEKDERFLLYVHLRKHGWKIEKRVIKYSRKNTKRFGSAPFVPLRKKDFVIMELHIQKSINNYHTAITEATFPEKTQNKRLISRYAKKRKSKQRIREIARSRLLVKASTGTIGYKGPKKVTEYAKTELLKNIAGIWNILGITRKFFSIFLHYSFRKKRTGRLFRKIYKSFTRHNAMALNFINRTRRTHGELYTKKARRV